MKWTAYSTCDRSIIEPYWIEEGIPYIKSMFWEFFYSVVMLITHKISLSDAVPDEFHGWSLEALRERASVWLAAHHVKVCQPLAYFTHCGLRYDIPKEMYQ